MHPVIVQDQATWNRALLRLPRPHVLQSWEWGSFKALYGWSPTRCLWQTDTGVPRAAALILERRLSAIPLSLLYVPKGPVLDYGDGPAWEAVLSYLAQRARRRRAVLVKIDPDVPATDEAVVARLVRMGWRPSPEQIQFRNTMLLDLTGDESTLLKAMKSKWRYNIRLAGRKGVRVRPGTLADLPMLYAMYHETAQRDHFVIRPLAYYQDAWGAFIQAGLAHPLIAEVEGEPVAMVILFRFGERAWYMYGASRSLHRDKMPNHLLQWEAMRWAKAQGCRVYDLWGAPDRLEPDAPMWGVYRFKQGFGAELVSHIGAYDYAPSRWRYWLYTIAMPRLLALMRRRYWARSAD